MPEFPPHPNLQSTLKKLEFDKVLLRISQLASSEVGKRLSLGILPLHDRSEIVRELEKTSEAKGLLIQEGSVPLDGVKDIIAALKKTSVANQTLTIQELLDIASTLRASRTVRSFLQKRRNHYPLLGQISQELVADKVVEFNIGEALDEQGFVKDSASKELRIIRKDIVVVSDQLRKRLSSLLRKISEQELLQEEIITTRDGRLVIPVKAEHKNHVPGFIHSSSASGATVYIEPAETLDLNNGLRELHLREEREVQRILQELTAQVRYIREPLEKSLWGLAEIDVTLARGRYSIEVVGSPPILANVPVIVLEEARHPVLLLRLGREKVVPLTLKFDPQVRTLVITGPNAGGKTVALKTIGLATLCAMSGIHVSSSSSSQIFPFEKVFVDIGDDQSIENDLSTFSSHLVRLKEVLGEANSKSLVLVDEIGAGTDPSEGGALAASILKELTDRGVTSVATTHNGALKVFAHETPGMANGSMEFDQTTLRPTYRFRFGVPGSSFALELADRLGIEQQVLENARGQLGEDKSKLERLIADLEKKAQQYVQDLRDAAKERDRLDSLVKSYEEKMSGLRKEMSEIKRKAVEEARQLVQDAQAIIERSVKEIRESAASNDVTRSSRQRIKDLVDRFRVHSVEESQTPDEMLRVGDAVRIRGSNQPAEIVELDGSSATVLTRNARIKISRKELTRNNVEAPVTQSSGGVAIQSDVRSEIDLRGLMGDEAIAEVQTFLDNAYAGGLHRVDIIHGKGTGALRKRIAEFLKSYAKVKTFRLGEWNEGGTGVTVVEFTD